MANAPGQGRKPKASTIIERQRDTLPAPEARRLPSAPAHLSAMAKTEWRRTGHLLMEAGLFADLDQRALAAYCTTYARWVEAEEQVQKFGTVIKVPSGFLVQSPYVAISNKALEQMVRMLQEFGMTPASRTRLPQRAAAKPKRQQASSAPGNDPRDVLRLMEGGKTG